MVEVAYFVDPAHRRRGFATALLAAALAWASADPAVRTVRASISPDNVASLATLRPFGFVEVGEQWDEEDGLELLFELPVNRRPDVQAPGSRAVSQTAPYGGSCTAPSRTSGRLPVSRSTTASASSPRSASRSTGTWRGSGITL